MNNYMTLKEIKDQVAIEDGYESFNDFIRKQDFRLKIRVARSVESLMDEVAERYAQQKLNIASVVRPASAGAVGRTVGIGAAGCGKCGLALRCSADCYTSFANANCCQRMTAMRRTKANEHIEDMEYTLVSIKFSAGWLKNCHA